MHVHRIARVVTALLVVALAFALTPVVPRAHAQAGMISYGEVVTGTITAKNYFQVWQFSGTQGDRVRITMIGDGALDPYLGLIELSTEQVIAEDDDSAGNMNAMMELSLPSTGDYAIIATRYNLDTGTSTGQYELSLQGGAGPNQNVNTVSNQSVNMTQPVEIEPGLWYYGELELGSSVNAAISNDAYAHVYTVTLDAGTEFVAAMFADGSNLDSYLIFGTEDGTVLAEDDDSGADVGGGTYDALIYLTVQQPGTYLLIASRVGLDMGTSTGNYMLFAGVPEPEDTPAPVDTQGLPPGVEVMGEISTGAQATGTITQNSFLHLYAFQGNAGEQITITMRSTDGLDSYLGIMDPSDEVIAEDDDSGGGASGYDAQISLRLPESGVYVIVATRAGIDQGISTGSYTLQVTSGAPAAPQGISGFGGFGGLPGRAIETGEGTLFLRGTGRSSDPDKQSELERFLQPQAEGEQLPGRSFKTPDLTVRLYGTGRSADPAKQTPLEQFLGSF